MTTPIRYRASPHKDPGKPMPCEDLMCVRNTGKGVCGHCLVLVTAPGVYACGGGQREDLLL